jgi:hypothetical protein
LEGKVFSYLSKLSEAQKDEPNNNNLEETSSHFLDNDVDCNPPGAPCQEIRRDQNITVLL